ncbi:hypothetical protein, partial [uncultured Allobaculum sp.]
MIAGYGEIGRFCRMVKILYRQTFSVFGCSAFYLIGGGGSAPEKIFGERSFLKSLDMSYEVTYKGHQRID